MGKVWTSVWAIGMGQDIVDAWFVRGLVSATDSET